MTRHQPLPTSHRVMSVGPHESIQWAKAHSSYSSKGGDAAEDVEEIQIRKKGNLTVIPLNYFKNLNRIEMSFNKLAGPFPSLSANSALIQLIIPHNHLEEIPNCSGLHNLKLVDLSFNDIAEMSLRKFEGCTKLETLDLSNNHLRTLPDLSQLPALRHLKASHNQISSVDSKSLVNLELLHLGHNKMNEVKTLETKDLMACSLAFNNLHDPPDLKIHHLMDLQLCLDGNPIKQSALKAFCLENKIQQVSATEANATFMGTGLFRSFNKAYSDSKQKKTGTKRKMGSSYCGLRCVRNGYEADDDEEEDLIDDDQRSCVIA